MNVPFLRGRGSEVISREHAIGEMDVPGPIIFIHIPKTAGTFVRSVLERLYKSVATAYPTPPHTSLSNKSGEEIARMSAAEVIIGHEAYHSFNNFFGERPVFTLVRNPVDRVISYYNHLMSYHPGFSKSKMSVMKFLEREEDIELDNLQVRYLSGRPLTEKPNEGSLERAIELIDSGKIAVGVQELIEPSFRTLSIFQDVSAVKFLRQNEAVFGFSRASMTEQEIARIRASQALDFSLYEHCLRRLRQEA